LIKAIDVAVTATNIENNITDFVLAEIFCLFKNSRYIAAIIIALGNVCGIKNIKINDKTKDKAIKEKTVVVYLFMTTSDILSANPDVFIPWAIKYEAIIKTKLPDKGNFSIVLASLLLNIKNIIITKIDDMVFVTQLVAHKTRTIATDAKIID
jgi:hypothetical protein